MKKGKIICIALALTFSVGAFTACTERTGGGTFTYEELMAKFDGEIEQNATIRVLDNQMAIETGHLQEVLDAFNERYAEYNVNAVDANMDQYVDLEQNGPDGYGPDVLYQANDMLMRYAEGGHVLPLPTEELEIAEIPQTVMDVYKLETYGLELYYGMPVAQQSTVLTYRKDLLPENWESEWDDNENGVRSGRNRTATGTGFICRSSISTSIRAICCRTGRTSSAKRTMTSDSTQTARKWGSICSAIWRVCSARPVSRRMRPRRWRPISPIPRARRSARSVRPTG